MVFWPKHTYPGFIETPSSWPAWLPEKEQLNNFPTYTLLHAQVCVVGRWIMVLCVYALERREGSEWGMIHQSRTAVLRSCRAWMDHPLFRHPQSTSCGMNLHNLLFLGVLFRSRSTLVPLSLFYLHWFCWVKINFSGLSKERASWAQTQGLSSAISEQINSDEQCTKIFMPSLDIPCGWDFITKRLVEDFRHLSSLSMSTSDTWSEAGYEVIGKWKNREQIWTDRVQ